MLNIFLWLGEVLGKTIVKSFIVLAKDLINNTGFCNFMQIFNKNQNLEGI